VKFRITINEDTDRGSYKYKLHFMVSKTIEMSFPCTGNLRLWEIIDIYKDQVFKYEAKE